MKSKKHDRRWQRPKRRKGISILEVMVVVAAVALVGVILYGTFRGSLAMHPRTSIQGAAR
jgi:hypothetical protein